MNPFKYWMLVGLAAFAVSACSPGQSAAPQSASADARATGQSGSAAQNAENDAGFGGYKEKLDMLRLQQALVKAGFQSGQEKKAEWDRRLAVAQTNAEIQAVLADQLGYFRRAEQSMSEVTMHSTRGRAVHQDFTKGFGGMKQALLIMQGLDLNDPANEAKVQEQVLKMDVAAKHVASGIRTWMAMMQENNLGVSEQDAEIVEQKIRELESGIQ